MRTEVHSFLRTLSVLACAATAACSDAAPPSADASPAADVTATDVSAADASAADVSAVDAPAADAGQRPDATSDAGSPADAAGARSTWMLNAEPACAADATCTDMAGIASGYQYNATAFCPTNSQVLMVFHHNADGSPPAAGSYAVRAASSTIDMVNVPDGQVSVRIQHVTAATAIEQVFAQSGVVTVTVAGGVRTATFTALPSRSPAGVTATMTGSLNCL